MQTRVGLMALLSTPSPWGTIGGHGTTQAGGNPLARPHYADSQILGCNVTLFPTSWSTLGLPGSWPQEQRSVPTTGPD